MNFINAVSPCELQQTQISLDLLSLLYEDGSNLVLSPYSLVAALMMLLPGTDGNTRAQLLKSLFNAKDSKNEAEKHVKQFAAINKANLVKNKATLKVANLLYSHKDFKLKPAYVSILTEQLNSTGKELDFINQKERALKTINNDVSKATNGLIENLLGNINGSSVLILVNAIYFKGLWKYKFNKEDTDEEGEFYPTPETVIKTPMMFMQKKFPYFFDEVSQTRAVQLNYQKDGNIAMVLILSKKFLMVDFLKNELTSSKLHHILNHLRVGSLVNLTLPRFKLSATHQLVEPLTKIGLSDVFDPSKANLSRISSEQVFVSEVLQKAIIEVNEEGTEAAAAATVVLQTKARPRACPKIVDFRANCPFIFALVTQDKPKQVLFIGVVEDPSKKNSKFF